MKRLLIFFVIFLLLAAGCSKASAPDYLATIRKELLEGESSLNKAVAEAVTLTLDKVEAERITVSVTAPDVCSEALAWFDGIEESAYSDGALDAQLVTLLKGEASKQTFTLALRGEEIVYTQEFLNAVSCGLREFYAALNVRLMQEMEETLDD